MLSFLLGLISGTSMPMLLVKPVIFALVFFIISGLIGFLVNHFLPELLDESVQDEDKGLSPGSRIDIIEGDSSDVPLSFTRANSPALGAQPDDSDNGLGNISDLLNKSAAPQDSGGGAYRGSFAGLDQKAQDSYTREEGMEAFSVMGSFSPLEPASPSGTMSPAETPSPRETLSPAQTASRMGVYSDDVGSDSTDVLPDLDSMAGAFLPASVEEESDATEYSVSTPSQKPSSRAKGPGWAGDFKAKDMAAGLRTILSKEKEG